MSDPIFSKRKNISAGELNEAAGIPEMKTSPDALDGNPGFQITGNAPPEFLQALAKRESLAAVMNQEQGKEPSENQDKPPQNFKIPEPTFANQSQPMTNANADLQALLNRLDSQHTFDEIELPSRGKFYKNIPGVLNLRAMTGQEEQILASPRYNKQNMSIDMIFERCIKEPIRTLDLLVEDRTFLLIYLRGISYTPEYDVEIKCPYCGTKFGHTINLNDLEVEMCDDNFGPHSLTTKLPESGLELRYRLETGADDRQVTSWRERRLKDFGDTAEEETLIYRNAQLIESLAGFTNKNDIMLLLKKLPIVDTAFIRNAIFDLPFGVDTDVGILCPACNEDFKIELPMSPSFFFPRKKEK